ncbi:uncharacterized protein LOC108671601 [Hyalella azteca]|uniref:Uncharacterized protein LOC108671601 n=1 Tax=Hyalella azteca TaxID=294128 RepID=A0A8B7NLV9_HYAAZ|nr:uncharacterized protein LOC108671601 [Hyalella azteca]
MSDSKFEVLGVVGGGTVKNGTCPLVVMDCQYNIPDGEEAAGLVVKWYHGGHGGKFKLVYQWIQGMKPQALGILRGRLDLNYEASFDPLKAHSALAFIRPTAELAGDYKCKVSTHLHEGSATGNLVLYTSASSFNIQVAQDSLSRVTVNCVGEGVYPEPDISLSSTDLNTRKRTPIHATIYKDRNKASNLYRVSATASIPTYQLNKETVFGCALSLPGTDYRLEDRLLYHLEAVRNDNARSAASMRSTSLALQPSPLLFLLALAFYWYSSRRRTRGSSRPPQ